MFRATHRISRPPNLRIPNRSAQTGMMAAKRATKTAYTSPIYREPKTSSLKTILPQRSQRSQRENRKRRAAIYSSVLLCVLCGNLSSPFCKRATIARNSAIGFSSFTCKMLRRAFKTQSNFSFIASSSARLNLKLSRKSRLARLRSCALPIAFLVAVMPTRCLSSFAGKMKTVIKRPSKRCPCS